MTVKTMMFLMLLTAALIAAAWGLASAIDNGEVELRIQARALDGGRVEVAVQPRADEGWGNRQLPELRFLPADAELGRWKSSSPVSVATPDSSEPLESLYCLVTHESPGDEEFWGLVSFGARQWDELHETIRVEVHAGTDADAQSAMVDQCIEAGALAIGLTLPDPQGVEAAIARAIDAGVYVNSFNSGLSAYGDVGSIRHVSVDEVGAGRQAGDHFNAADAGGVALCIIHESSNIGLEERCQGLDDTYEGEVRRVNIGASGLTDREASSAAIAEALTDDIAAVLSLNSRVSILAMELIAASEADVVLGTFDQNGDVLSALTDGQIEFALDTSPFAQAWYTLSTMLNNQPAFSVLVNEIGVADPQQVLGTFDIQLSPRLITAENAEAFMRVNSFTAAQR